MPRKIIVTTAEGGNPILVETGADNEYELQELMKANPDLLPIEEFGLTGPVLVVGRETSVASGAIDLACLARSGDILIIEFKTGPQNTDFRHAVSQLLDYGAQLWQSDFAEFEQAVAVRFFNDARYCRDPRLLKKGSLAEAARAVWDDLTDDEWSGITDRITAQLQAGSFHYVLAAQRFTASVEKIVEYMNAIAPNCRFYAVEIVKFVSGAVSAYESRTLLKPSISARTTYALISEVEFLSKIADEAYNNTPQKLFEACRGLGYRFEWGSLGGSIRLPTPFRSEPITVAWIFPPGRSGWAGLTDFTMGYDPWSANHATGSLPYLEAYVARVKDIPGATPLRSKNMAGSHFEPSEVTSSYDAIVAALDHLRADVG